MRCASLIYLGVIDALFVYNISAFVSWISSVIYDSAASCSVITAESWKRASLVMSCAISRMSRWKGSVLSDISGLFFGAVPFRIDSRPT